MWWKTWQGLVRLALRRHAASHIPALFTKFPWHLQFVYCNHWHRWQHTIPTARIRSMRAPRFSPLAGIPQSVCPALVTLPTELIWGILMPKCCTLFCVDVISRVVLDSKIIADSTHHSTSERLDSTPTQAKSWFFSLTQLMTQVAWWKHESTQIWLKRYLQRMSRLNLTQIVYWVDSKLSQMYKSCWAGGGREKKISQD